MVFLQIRRSVITPILHYKAKVATRLLSAPIGKSGFDFLYAKLRYQQAEDLLADLRRLKEVAPKKPFQNFLASATLLFIALVIGAGYLFLAGKRKVRLAFPLPAPEAFVLYPNVPNPFNPSTTIQYDLPETAEITLEIFDMPGRHVRTLANEPKPAGHYSVVWDGRDERGKMVASGVFLYQLRVGNPCYSHLNFAH